ncbi:hypothetical protein D0T49_04445 [Paludibacter sp. 221]|uniref:hypothetical protein n=1 Tax=Paludibacter sp. 221 TaxID=2302939 RepID=UPI0013D89392|nr:hypothetical protein [Paludibacter sp. 221]NDV46286.1 hypothetical protein [Paludibacter sp. 221]
MNELKISIPKGYEINPQKTDLKTGVIYFREIEEVKPYVLINGLKWDRENTCIDGKELFNYYEALGVAQHLNKRLPTSEEWEALAELGSTWDKEKKGRWFGHDHELKNKSKQSIFLPAAGYRSPSNGELYDVGYYGLYWSDSLGSVYSLGLGFHSSDVYPANLSYRSGGLSVRCISE